MSNPGDYDYCEYAWDNPDYEIVEINGDFSLILKMSGINLLNIYLN